MYPHQPARLIALYPSLPSTTIDLFISHCVPPHSIFRSLLSKTKNMTIFHYYFPILYFKK
ncbi:hypothetical protein CW304_13160 [Bacillus sp. UFRGS-B20]|nr:hypothetical protein CW304_13160 [Bacillus sp. UFRGS-B20]